MRNFIKQLEENVQKAIRWLSKRKIPASRINILDGMVVDFYELFGLKVQDLFDAYISTELLIDIFKPYFHAHGFELSNIHYTELCDGLCAVFFIELPYKLAVGYNDDVDIIRCAISNFDIFDTISSAYGVGFHYEDDINISEYFGLLKAQEMFSEHFAKCIKDRS